ncbi:MAG TPA: hypothetical protein VHW03_00835 [Chthoniobacterales bacterium]|nr:hypothetical protein [Chthoniobacterales bacterium]
MPVFFCCQFLHAGLARLAQTATPTPASPSRLTIPAAAHRPPKLGTYREYDPGPDRGIYLFDHPCGRARIRMAMAWKQQICPRAMRVHWRWLLVRPVRRGAGRSIFEPFVR